MSVIVEAVLFLEAFAGSSGLCSLSSVGSLSHTRNQPRKEAGPEKGSKASSSDSGCTLEGWGDTGWRSSRARRRGSQTGEEAEEVQQGGQKVKRRRERGFFKVKCLGRNLEKFPYPKQRCILFFTL